jgi:hypothetical protein
LKRLHLSIISCVLAIGVLAAVSVANAAETPVTEAPVSSTKVVEVTGSGWVVSDDGTVTYNALPPASEAAAPSASPLSPATGCVANTICVYANTNYGSLQGEIGCGFTGAVKSSGALKSALNRCGNKTNYLRADVSVVACMNPGGSRPEPGGFNEVYVLANYGAFC